ncbi:hypothetical protein EVAR_30520_1 [Eumeta japonica]|uniref:Uncharacterized protein n=1 Tax=Eumeta variegata TaxID=151549 RepID=A0A4C1VWQ2_EUMVA|nr:hypothetical protein EVAR_30520_1 [Eumeta japonica]
MTARGAARHSPAQHHNNAGYTCVARSRDRPRRSPPDRSQPEIGFVTTRGTKLGAGRGGRGMHYSRLISIRRRQAADKKFSFDRSDACTLCAYVVFPARVQC